jgi:hypothetical protein
MHSHVEFLAGMVLIAPGVPEIESIHHAVSVSRTDSSTSPNTVEFFVLFAVIIPCRELCGLLDSDGGKANIFVGLATATR